MANSFNFGGGVNSVPQQPAQDWQLQSQGLNRKRALMDALMAQNMSPTPIQQVSGRVVNNGLLDGFSKIAMTLALKGGYDKADQQQAAIQHGALARQAQARNAMHAAGAPKDIADIQSRAAAAQGIDPSFNPWADEGFKTWLDIFKQKEVEAAKGPEYGDIKFDKDGPYRLGKRGEVLRLQGVGKDQKMNNINGVFLDENATTPGQIAPQDYNKPIVLGEDGKPVPNEALQAFEKEKAKLSASNISIKMTEDQRKQTSFGLRAQPAHDTINALLESGYKPNAKDWYTAGPAATNWLSSARGQEYMNAGKEFVAGVLRGDSGATITDTEWANGKIQYIPLPGDTPAVIAQKNRNREQVLKGFLIGSGPGASHIPAPGSAKAPIQPQKPEGGPTNSAGGWSYGGVQK